MAVDEFDVEALERILADTDGLDHLFVKKRGDSLTICSGGHRTPYRHARLSALGGGVWGLSFPHHSGRWERTPFIGTMDEVVGTLINDFGFYLDDIEQPPAANPGRINDPSN